MSNTTYGIEDYSYDYLSEGDKASVDVMERLKENVLNDEVIADFIDSKSSGTLQNVHKELLVDFIDFFAGMRRVPQVRFHYGRNRRLLRRGVRQTQQQRQKARAV